MADEPPGSQDEPPATSLGHDAVEAAIAGALSLAAEAGRFDVVAQLARELEARRTARAGNVVPLERRRKGGE